MNLFGFNTAARKQATARRFAEEPRNSTLLSEVESLASGCPASSAFVNLWYKSWQGVADACNN
ncbi:MAG: hypothetical protein F6K32_02640 [Desertifilum sp. SIO1I2]|nr:hypothetical protein [Desertifilum sp. SIO1I2]